MIFQTHLFVNSDCPIRGFFLARDRMGEAVKVPLLGISIAIVPMDSPQILHAWKAAEIAAELEELAKQQPGSSHGSHRRKGNAIGPGAGDRPTLSF